MNPPSTTADDRLDLWQSAASAELNDLVHAAATIRMNITTAKTQAKKQYFEKKFKKVQADVMRMLVTLERLKSTMSPPVRGGSDDPDSSI